MTIKLRQRVAAWLNRMVRVSPYVWADEPTVDGWYWIRAKELTPRITRVYKDKRINTWIHDYWHWPYFREHKPYQFAGPIHFPNDVITDSYRKGDATQPQAEQR